MGNCAACSTHIAEHVWCMLHPRNSMCLFARVCRATCSFCPTRGAADVLGSAWPMLGCACVCCWCRTHRSLPDHKFDLELGSYLPNSQQPLPLQILSSPDSQRRGVSSVVTASLSKAAVSLPIAPRSKSAGRQRYPPHLLHTPQTMAEPLPAIALLSPLCWRESGYSLHPCE